MRTLILVVLLGCLTTLASDAPQDSDSDVGSKIIALENLWNQAAEAKDVDALHRILDDAFVYVGPDGTLLTKAQVLIDVRASSGIRATSQSMVVHLHGDTAVVTGIYRISGVEHGKPFARRDRFVDTWLCKNGSWISIASLETPSAF